MENYSQIPVLNTTDDFSSIETVRPNENRDNIETEAKTTADFCNVDSSTEAEGSFKVDDEVKAINTLLSKKEKNDNETDLLLDTLNKAQSESVNGQNETNTEIDENGIREYSGNSLENVYKTDSIDRQNLFENETLIMEVSDHSDNEIHHEDVNSMWNDTNNEIAVPSDDDVVMHQMGQVDFASLEHEQPNSMTKTCKVCMETFAHEDELKDHIRAHAFEGIHKCKYCDKQYIGLRRLKEHMQLHKMTSFTCQLCKEAFLSQEELYYHKRIIHPIRRICYQSSLRKRNKCPDSIARRRREMRMAKKAESITTSSIKSTSNKQNKMPKVVLSERVNTRKNKIDKVKRKPESYKATRRDRQKTPETKSAADNIAGTNGSKHGVRNSNAVKKPKKLHSCEYCNKICRTPSHLKEHLISHTGCKPFSCEICDKSFVRKKALREHMSLHDGASLSNSSEKVNTITSDTVIKGTGAIAGINDNVSKKEEPDKVTHDVVDDLPSVKTSKNTHSCEFCKKEFRTPSRLKEHLISHTGNKPHICEVCGKSYVRKIALREHLSLHAGIKLYSCEVCQKDFATKDAYTYHFWEHDGIKPFCCETCGKSFIRRSHLNEHMRTHNDIKEHECHICLKQFSVKKSLKFHMLVHTGERLFLCSICGRSFNNARTLEKHQFTHDENKKFTCQLCQISFDNRSDLKTHQRSASHTLTKTELCERCGNEFTLKYLKQHQRTCEGVRTYKCKRCEQVFSNTALLNAHKNFHYTENHHQCEICGKHFKDSWKLNRHHKVHE